MHMFILCAIENAMFSVAQNPYHILALPVLQALCLAKRKIQQTEKSWLVDQALEGACSTFPAKWLLRTGQLDFTWLWAYFSLRQKWGNQKSNDLSSFSDSKIFCNYLNCNCALNLTHSRQIHIMLLVIYIYIYPISVSPLHSHRICGWFDTPVGLATGWTRLPQTRASSEMSRWAMPRSCSFWTAENLSFLMVRKGLWALN